MPPPNKRAVARILSVPVGTANEQRAPREIAREEAARQGLSLGEYLARQLDQNERAVTETEAQPRAVRHAYDDEDDDWSAAAPALERSPAVGKPADRSSLDEAAIDNENAAPENEIGRAARGAFRQALSAIRALVSELQSRGIAYSFEGDLFASGKTLSKPTQLIIRIDGDRFQVKFDRVAKEMAQNAPNNDELFERIAELHDSGVLALVTAEARQEIRDLIEMAVARAEEENWQPVEVWNPSKEDAWPFYCRVYRGKNKPSARSLGLGDQPLYRSLSARAVRNRDAGLPRTPDTPHSIHDLFPPRLGPGGRPVRASRRTPKPQP